MSTNNVIHNFIHFDSIQHPISFNEVMKMHGKEKKRNFLIHLINGEFSLFCIIINTKNIRIEVY